MISRPTDLTSLRYFRHERILNEDPLTHALTLLGTFPQNGEGTGERAPAIVRIEKTPLRAELASELLSDVLSSARLIESTDIYTWLFAWLSVSPERPDVKVNITFPATEVHIRKYSAQDVLIVHETPDQYQRIVKPYIAAFPSSRTKWVEDILGGRSEAHKVLYREHSSDLGYVLLPDMKWDLTTLSSLYLVAISVSRDIHSLRDLNKHHLDMLRSIRREAARVVKERWGLRQGSLRMFVHYQPSYYRFHVHIVNANYQGLAGMTVGQAHLLDDVISLLELDPPDEPSIFQRMTLTYGLGDQHGLYEVMKAEQSDDVPL
ncbi:scavenger mRNA decapping enzyme [Sparassis latifolia]|uniref:M7GpppX diphosphatase n=1 Tax=Sparassis crispa TaxID=139825 RepID=A0A401GZR4_9APHY|nr:m7GpppX diphosphatase [Sparassis crispa]GBE87666.1 m7GpppX diphosphatase [Sparassis crispa]